MFSWLTDNGFSPHGFCLTWDPGLILAHASSDTVMGLSYIACGAVISWFGRRRPDMAPPALFWSLSVVFALCGLTHLSDIATLWWPVYEPQVGLKVVTAVSSAITISVLVLLAPRALQLPSIAQLRELNERLGHEKEEHRQTARQLARLAAAIEQNPNSVMLTDSGGRIEYVNASFLVSTGYAAAEVVGQNPSMLAAGSTPRWVYDNLWHTVQGRREWRGELKDRRKDGSEFWVACSIAPIHNQNHQIDGFVAIQQDISDRKAAEEEMVVAKRQAEIANRAKSEILANMSHELRTPLNAIIGFSEMMSAGTFGPLGCPKYEEYSHDIQASARHLLDLINDVLDVSAIEAGKLTLFDERAPIAQAVQSAFRMVSERAGQQSVELHMGPLAEVELIADQRRLKQILINLLSNAIKFTPAGGTVSVSAALARDRSLSLSVTDTGIGMTDEEIELALQPFGQVDGSMQRRQQGTGLGLPICMGIMERHGGTLRLDSIKGTGTTVIATFPATRVFAPNAESFAT